MSNPALGNKATEMGQFEKGADFTAVNQGEIVPRPEEVPVRITEVPEGIAIVPERNLTKGDLRLREDHTAITKAQIFDDPFMERGGSPEAIEQAVVEGIAKLVAIEMQRRSPQRDKMVFYQVTPDEQMAAFGERIIVMQDSQESAYSCRTCKGKGHTKEYCALCGGKPMDETTACKNCRVLGFGREIWYPSGHNKCGDCQGSGWRGGIVIPDEHQKMPITGIVVSVGPMCVNLRVGDRVVHSRYAGQTLTSPDGSKYTTMNESEVTNLLRRVSS